MKKGEEKKEEKMKEMREKERIGAVDKNGVRTRNVDTRLDDGRAYQDVIALVVEVSHDLF